jgi:hypothetical protein
MTSRRARIATAIALSSVPVALTAASCNSQQFTSNDTNPSDAGTAGSSNPSSPSAGANGEGGAANASNDAGAPNTTGSSGSTGATGEGGAAGNDSHSSAGTSNAAGGSENDAGSSGTSATGNEAGHGGSPALPDCDPRWSPVEESCVIDEQHGVFVSPLGSDTDGNGSREAPFATIARGVASAITNSRRVYACADAGAYTESVSIDLADGLELYGGFSCADWSYDTKLKSVVASGSTRALHVSQVSRLRFEDFRFEAVDATTPGESSIAAWVVDSSEVVFVRSAFEAGRGASGVHGGLIPFSYPAEGALAGNVPTSGASGVGAAEKRCVCQTEELASTGGAGGPTETPAGTSGLPNYEGPGGEAGMWKENLCIVKPNQRSGNGADGGDAPATAPGSGAMTLGVADRNGWHPTAGSNGEIGAPGQGGGGGASLRIDANDPPGAVSRGGGGGCGGCGGNGGTAGRGGGGSVALLVLDADVALSNSELITSDGGDGGNGHVGQEGQQTVGVGGAGVEACRGGNGGKGARGGAGGGGAGGVSVGIVWSGPNAPAQLETTVETGVPGVGGLGAELDVNDGIDGVAQAMLQVM